MAARGVEHPCPVRCDANLVKRAREGDADAFGQIFHTHKAKVYAVCLKMTANTAEAEDLTQDAFLQVFRKLRTFRGDSAFSTWLYRVAVNTVLMHFRRKKDSLHVPFEQSTEDSGGVLPKVEHGMPDPRLSNCADRLALKGAMASLPAGYRNIFLLHEVSGYGHREIAAMLRCSIGNSKSQLHKAKSKMRMYLGGAARSNDGRSSLNRLRPAVDSINQ